MMPNTETPTPDDRRRLVTQKLDELEELAGDGFLSEHLVRILRRAHRMDSEPPALDADAARKLHQDSDWARNPLRPPLERVDVLPDRTARRIDIENALALALEREIEPRVKAARALWKQRIREANRAADEAQNGVAFSEPGKTELAAGWLRHVLSQHPRGIPSKQLRRQAEAAGHAWGTVKEAAKQETGARSIKRGKVWSWALRFRTEPSELVDVSGGRG